MQYVHTPVIDIIYVYVCVHIFTLFSWDNRFGTLVDFCCFSMHFFLIIFVWIKYMKIIITVYLFVYMCVCIKKLYSYIRTYAVSVCVCVCVFVIGQWRNAARVVYYAHIQRTVAMTCFFSSSFNSRCRWPPVRLPVPPPTSSRAHNNRNRYRSLGHPQK